MRMTGSPRSGVLAVALLALAGLLLAACGGEAKVLDGTAADIFAGDCVDSADDDVTIYSGRSENLMQPVLDAFTCETGIDVQVRWGGNSDLALQLDEEGDRTSADVFLSSSPGPIAFLQDRGHLGTIDGDVLGLVADEHQASSGAWVGFSGRKRVAVYNVDNITPADLPASVFDLTDEQWRDRVAIPATNGSFQDWFTVFRDQFGNDVATQWINDMAANGATYYPNNRSIVEAAGRGEIDIGLVNHYYNFQEAAAIGDDHRALNHDLDDGDIGSLLIITAATITSASDNTDGANELVRYLLSEPVQRYYTDETFEYPLAAGVEPADILPPLAALEAGSINFDALGGGLELTSEIVEASGIANQ